MSTAQDVIDRVRELINDEETAFASSLAWTDAELLEWLTDAQRQIVTLKPESNPRTDFFLPELARPRQQLLEANAQKLIRVEANSGEGALILIAEEHTEEIIGIATEYAYGYKVQAIANDYTATPAGGDVGELRGYEPDFTIRALFNEVYDDGAGNRNSDGIYLYLTGTRLINFFTSLTFVDQFGDEVIAYSSDAFSFGNVTIGGTDYTFWRWFPAQLTPAKATTYEAFTDGGIYEVAIS